MTWVPASPHMRKEGTNSHKLSSESHTYSISPLSKQMWTFYKSQGEVKYSEERNYGPVLHPSLIIIGPNSRHHSLWRRRLIGALRPFQCLLCKASQPLAEGKPSHLSHWKHHHTYFHLSSVTFTFCGILQFLSAIGPKNPEALCTLLRLLTPYAYTELLLSELWSDLTG